ncbi:MAG: GNAT family N-acetyltransferase [Chloroflexi bacterium]|uniref:GNAT family N-acetyltransferase n=1 Tax=Candidatus Flexifilum breve TaxID=3140694 RepID=UPI0031363D66|nr:GNAT family N-acetyltransferase [Chloroflexota bacterium]
MDIQTIELISMRAWPALEEVDYDGWRLRSAKGYTGRANSVYPFSAGMVALDEKIDHCERFYAERGLKTRFKLTAAAQPAELDHALEARGYTIITPTNVLTLDLMQLAEVPAPSNIRLSLEATFSEAWLDAYVRLSGVNPAFHSIARQLLQRATAHTIFGAAYDGDQIIAVTLGVRDGEWIGLYDVVTQAERRGQGIGGALITQVLRQGQVSGATRGYLQVLGTNAPAFRLYTRLGYQMLYTYWYRLQG